MTTTVRPLTPDEIGSEAFLPLLWEAAGVDADALLWIRDAELPRLTVVGVVAGGIRGFAAFGPDPARGRTELHYIAVAHEARGTGLGSRLVDAAGGPVGRLRRDRPRADPRRRAPARRVRRLRRPRRRRRHPRGQRYDCTIPPLGDPLELTLAVYRDHALRYAQRTSGGSR
ncbi:hypothetical protein MhomT_00085 [Microbacterium hominis]|nr:GNAT family N-acetyltransferase [Microbacterium hominis]KXC07437.1 hypothetical protein MhomT_00085 [Microbacterium hominis]